VRHPAASVRRHYGFLQSRRFQDAASYDSCDLETHAAPPIDIAPREHHDLIAFRAIHRVTPITHGHKNRWLSGRRACNSADQLRCV